MASFPAPPEWQLALERAARAEDWASLVKQALVLPPVALWHYLNDPVAPTDAWRHHILKACGYPALDQAYQEQVKRGHLTGVLASAHAIAWAQTQAPLTTPLAATVLLSRYLLNGPVIQAPQESMIEPFLMRLASGDRTDFMMKPYIHPAMASQAMFERIMDSLVSEDQQRWAPMLLRQSVYLGDEAQIHWAQTLATQVGVTLTTPHWTNTLWMTVVNERADLGTALARQHPEAVAPLIQQIMKNDDADVKLADDFLAHWLPMEQLEATCVTLEEGGLRVNDRLPQTRQKRLAQQRWQTTAEVDTPARPLRRRRRS